MLNYSNFDSATGRIQSVEERFATFQMFAVKAKGFSTELANSRSSGQLQRLHQLDHVVGEVALARSGLDCAADGQLTLIRDLQVPEQCRALKHGDLDRLMQVASWTPAEDGGARIPEEGYA